MFGHAVDYCGLPVSAREECSDVVRLRANARLPQARLLLEAQLASQGDARRVQSQSSRESPPTGRVRDGKC